MGYWSRFSLTLIFVFKASWGFAQTPGIEGFTIDTAKGYARVELSDGPPNPAQWEFQRFEKFFYADQEQPADYWFWVNLRRGRTAELPKTA